MLAIDNRNLLHSEPTPGLPTPPGAYSGPDGCRRLTNRLRTIRWMQTEKPTGVSCVECGRQDRGDDRGWRTYLTVDEDEPVDVTSTAARAPTEVGPARSRRAHT